MKNQQKNSSIAAPLILGGLIAIASCAGLLTDAYNQETVTWEIQSRGQDLINLCLILPVLIVTSFVQRTKAKYSLPLWAGTIMYLIYTYTIYCFDLHFNQFFLLYCAILGLSTYCLAYFFYFQIKGVHLKIPGPLLSTVTGIYFLVTALLFGYLWLSEIIPAVKNGTPPQSVLDAGLFTNPVHVLDLSVFLPGVFITGLLILKRKNLGFWLAPLILGFFVVMDIGIGTLAMIMAAASGTGGVMPVVCFMSGLAIVSMILLILNQRSKPLI